MQVRTRLFIAPTTARLDSQLILRLDDGHTHYLASVLRCTVGARIHLFNDHDGEWAAEIIFSKKGRCDVALKECIRPGARQGFVTTPGPTLVFSLLKRDATDMVVRMGTELGIQIFQPVITERTNTHRMNVQRLESIAKEATEQCERLDVPQFAPVVSLPALLSSWPSTRTLFVGLERVQDTFPAQIAVDWSYLVGPEGGFSEKEVSLLKKYSFTQAFSLGPNILRADTAAAAGISALTVACGRLKASPS